MKTKRKLLHSKVTKNQWKFYSFAQFIIESVEKRVTLFNFTYTEMPC